jgi:hypothetical protein
MGLAGELLEPCETLSQVESGVSEVFKKFSKVLAVGQGFFKLAAIGSCPIIASVAGRTCGLHGEEVHLV